MQMILCNSFSFFAEAIILWQYASCLFAAKRPFLERFAVLCSLYLVLFTASFLESSTLNICLYFLTTFLFFISQYDLKWFSSLFHSSILTAIMVICEVIIFSVIERFTPHFFTETGNFYHVLLFAVFSKFLFFTIIYLLSQVIKSSQKNYREYDKSVLLLAFIPFSSCFIMHTLINMCAYLTLHPFWQIMITLSALLLLMGNLLIFGLNLHNQKKSREFTELQLLLQKESDQEEYYKMVQTQNEEQRILIHDIKKHLQSIVLLNEQGEQGKIHAYLQQLLHSSSLKKPVRLCDHKLLNSILCRYARECSDRRIALYTDIRSGSLAGIADIDVTSLFCNLLDNALEAADGVPDGFIELNVHQREHSPLIMVTLLNSCPSDPFATPSGLLLTHKPDKYKHGFGMKSIRKTVQKYHGDMKLYYTADTALFHTILTLKR